VATFRFRADGVNNVVINFADNNDGNHNEAFLNGFELSISIARDQASNPSPEDGAVDVWEKTILSWTPGFYAPAMNGHRVYFSDVFTDVKEIIVDLLGVDEAKVTPEARFREDLEADSLDIVELIMAFEDKFGSEISDEEAQKISAVGDVVKFIEQMKG